MFKKTHLLVPLLAIACTPAAFATETAPELSNNPDITIDYKVWFQDHETIGKRYVSAQNNLIKVTAHTQDGWMPNFSAQIGKAESNLFGYVNTDLRAFYVYDYSDNLSFDYGAGMSMRYDALHGKQGEASSLEWSAYDPHVALGVTYDIEQMDGLTLFGGFEKRINGESSSFIGGTTTEFGARYTFLEKGSKSITAEIGYRRDIQDADFTVTKTVETPDEGGDAETRTEGGGSTYTEVENRRMISDGFYLGVKMAF
ncbi:hypothetical protein OTK49_01185 [Vibrio coralliirubri]|uniref:hypothetical protein n=1 Tax=Vibrio coralliirubri TaxID=1516159 RepID=UPI002283E210|nr:hypothetical protein [Vibrio coralliirubri]MCY9861143.1 hypothetical protein [Vibrio coralliirubri]